MEHLCNAGTDLPGLHKIERRALDWHQVTSGDVLACHWCVVVPAVQSRLLLGTMLCTSVRATHSTRPALGRAIENARIDTEGVVQDSAAACKVPVGVLSHVHGRSLQWAPHTVTMKDVIPARCLLYSYCEESSMHVRL